MPDRRETPPTDVARLGLADAVLADDDPWVVVRAVRDAADEVTDFLYLLANAAAEDAVGLGPLPGRRMLELIPEVRDTVFTTFSRVLASGVREQAVMPSVVRPLQGWGPGWTALDVRATGELVVAHWQDTTAQQAGREAAERSDARLRALLENAGEVIVVFSPDGMVPLYHSPSMMRVLGREVSAPGLTTRVHPDDRERVQRALATLVAAGPGHVEELEVRLQHSAGHWLWVHGRATNHAEDPDVGGIVINLWDVTEQRTLADQLRRQALQDPLTGLPNRRFIDAELGRALSRMQRGHGRVGLVLCDVDDFKSVNDALGHPAGDELLVQVAERLRTLVRPSDTVGRLGGDEFVVICEDLHDAAELAALAERLQASLRGVYRVADRDLPVTVSVGASPARPFVIPTQLLSEADTALYEAKRAGRDGSQVFDQRVHRRDQDRATRRQALRLGVGGGQLLLHYQPKVRLDSGAVVGAEALVRWQHPADGLLLPYEFLPLAEESLLVVDVGRWVMRQAMVDAAGWRRSGRAPDEAEPLVSINVSGRHLTHPALLEDLDDALEHSGLAPTQLEVEITETVLLHDLEKTARVLREVRARGVRVALDDFGTGYSSLTWLQRLPVDTVKLDRSFVAALLSPEERHAPDILGSVTALAHALGKQVVAEGVETREQHDYLVGLRCDLAQGYLYGRPVAGGPFGPAAT